MTEKKVKKTPKKLVKKWLKIFDISLPKISKDPRSLEERLEIILKTGSFRSAHQMESPSTGRLYYSLVIEQGSTSDTKAKVFREHSSEVMQEKVNEFISKAPLKVQLQSVGGRSNFITKTLFVEK